MRIRILAAGLFAILWADGGFAQHKNTSPSTILAVPLNNPDGWITPYDFPSSLRDRVVQIVVADLTVSRGMITACATIGSPDIPELGALTCQLLTDRARFKPADSGTYHKFVYWPDLKALAPLGTGERRPESKISLAAPSTVPKSWVTSDDYPTNGKHFDWAAVGFRVWIGPDGRVTDCVAKSVLDPAATLEDMEKATCQAVTRHATFWPALDQAGNPVFGTYKDDVIWDGAPGDSRPGMRVTAEGLRQYVQAKDQADGKGKAEPPSAPPGVDLSFLLEKGSMPEGWISMILNADVLIGSDGATRQCSVRTIGSRATTASKQSSGPPSQHLGSLAPLADAVCNKAIASWKAEPVKDKDGKPVASIQRLTVRVAAGEVVKE